MADIDNLNFSVLLDDAKFKKTIEDDKRLAREFNADLSQILDFKGGLGKGIKIIEDGQPAKVGQVADGVKAIKKETEDLKGKTVRVTGEYEKQSGILRELGSMVGAYFSVRGVERFLSSLVRVTGEFEVQKMALTSMLGSAEVADEIFTTLRQSALESPYTFQDLAKYAKQLTAFNIDADKLVETEKMLADVSAGLGVDMGRIILAYGQVKAAGVLKGTELRQFTEAGVPLLQSLADQIERTEGKAIALSEVFSRISKKEIPFEMVEQAFRDMTSEGGKFYNMQEVLVQTLQGKIGKLRDVWQQALYDIGNSNSTVLKGAVDIVTALASHIDFIVKLLAPLVAGIGAYAAVAAVAWSLSKVQAVGQFVNYLLQLVKGLNAAIAATAAFGAASGVFATTAGAIGAVVAVLAALGVGIYEVAKAFDRESEAMRIVNKTTTAYNTALQTELSNARALLNTMGKLKQGTEEYDRAKDALLNKYGEYLSDLDKEKIAVGNLAGVYDNLHTSIVNATKARFKEQGMADLGKSFADSTRRIFKRVRDIAQGRIGRRAGGDSNDLEAELIAYVTGQSDLAGLSESGQSAVRMADINDSPMGRGLTHLRNAYAKAEGIVREGEQRLNKVFGESVMQTLITPNSDDKSKWDANWQNTQNDNAARAIENRISLLRTFKAAYDDLAKAGKRGDKAQELLLDIFGEDFADLIKTEDFDKAITDSLAELQKLDPEAYEKLALALGKEGLANALKELAQAGKEEKEIAKINLSSFWAQLEQISSEDNLKRIWDFYNAASNLYGLVTGGQIGTLVKTADGRPKGYNITKDEARAAGVDDNLIAQIFGDKEEIYATTEEIERLRKKANALMTIGGKGDGLKAIRNFIASVRAYSEAKAGGKNGLDEMLKNVKANAVDAANAIGSIGKKLDEITGVPLGEWIGDAASAVANIAGGNYVQGAFQVLDLIRSMGGYFKGLKEEYLELQATIAAAMRQYRYSLEDNEMGGFATIFGDNSYESFHRAARYVDEYEKRMEKWQKDLQGASKSYNTNGWWMSLMGVAGAATSLDFTKVSGISADTRSGWQKFWGTNKKGIVSLNKYMGDEWTQEKLKAYYDSYSKYLSTSHKALIEGMMEDWDRYEEYLQQETEFYKSIVGDVASEIADAWIDAFESAGDAATDFGKVMSNVADTIAKDLLTSLALSGLEDVLGEDYKEFTSLMHEGKSKEAMELLNQALQYVSTAMPDAANEILAWRDQYHQYEDEDGGAESSLSNGIKSITEDTANLLAAYINGIRADVAAGNSQRAEILALVREYVGAGSAPSYTEYLTQIEAHTANLAANTNAILSELRSIITPESGLPAVRVQTA